MSIHNMENIVALNMSITNFPKYVNNCSDCAFCADYPVCVDSAFHNFLAINSYFSWSKWLASLGSHKVTEDL